MWENSLGRRDESDHRQHIEVWAESTATSPGRQKPDTKQS